MRLNIEQFCNIVNESAKDMSEDKCFPEELNKEFSVYNFIKPEDTDLTALARFSAITTLFNSLMKNGMWKSFMQNYLGVSVQAKEFFLSLTD